MKLENIRTADEIENYIEGCLNDFQLGFRSKKKTVELIGELVVHIYKLALKERNNK